MHPGEHAVAVIINGKEMQKAIFQLNLLSEKSR